ncbi:MAG: glycosyltransferase [Bacillota bacterium]
MLARRPTLSLCMIVRDEEKTIGACLASVHGLVEEIVVVDTGSTDRTRAVAEKNGARVFSYPWRGDFAAARNYALAQANGSWILVLDADETLAPVAQEKLAGLLAAPGFEGYYLHIHSFQDDGTVIRDMAVRLFRNKPGYRFSGPIHEQVAGAIQSLNNGGGLGLADLVIHHWGYLRAAVCAKKKRCRNVAIIRRALRRTPDDPFLRFSLGIEYYQAGKFARGLGELEKALAFMSGREGYFRDAVVLVAAGLLQTGAHERLADFLAKAFRMFPDDPALRLILELNRAVIGGRGRPS